MPRCLLVVAQREFHDREYLDTVGALEAAGVAVETAAPHAGPAVGAFGLVLKPDRLLGDLRAEPYDGIALVGGLGARALFDHAPLTRLLKAALDQGKTVGAICLAPMILLRAGLAKERRVAIFPAERGRVRLFGALPCTDAVSEDGPLVTADGPDAARAFGETLARRMLARPQETSGNK